MASCLNFMAPESGGHEDEQGSQMARDQLLQKCASADGFLSTQSENNHHVARDDALSFAFQFPVDIPIILIADSAPILCNVNVRRVLSGHCILFLRNGLCFFSVLISARAGEWDMQPLKMDKETLFEVNDGRLFNCTHCIGLKTRANPNVLTMLFENLSDAWQFVSLTLRKEVIRTVELHCVCDQYPWFSSMLDVTTIRCAILNAKALTYEQCNLSVSRILSNLYLHFETASGQHIEFFLANRLKSWTYSYGICHDTTSCKFYYAVTVVDTITCSDFFQLFLEDDISAAHLLGLFLK